MMVSEDYKQRKSGNWWFAPVRAAEVLAMAIDEVRDPLPVAAISVWIKRLVMR